MRRARCAAVSVLVAVTSGAVGCAANRVRAPYPAPAALPSADELQTALAARRAAVHGLRALARLRYRDANGSDSSREAIVVARPDRLRVEVLSLFGAAYVLTADHGAISAYARQDDTVYRGLASPDNLWRYARMSLPLNDVVDLLLGTPPADGHRARVDFDAESGAIRLSHDVDAGTQVVWFSTAWLPIAAEQRGADGRAEWRATFTGYEDHGGVPIATRIGLDWPRWSRSMELALQDVDVNPSVDNSAFAFQAPPGSKVVNLDTVGD